MSHVSRWPVCRIDAYAELEHRAAVAEADAKAEEKKIEATNACVAALETELAKPVPITWQPIAAFGAAFLIGVIVGVLVAK